MAVVVTEERRNLDGIDRERDGSNIGRRGRLRRKTILRMPDEDRSTGSKEGSEAGKGGRKSDINHLSVPLIPLPDHHHHHYHHWNHSPTLKILKKKLMKTQRPDK